MARVRYLADTSVFARLTESPVAVAFAPLAAQGQVAVRAPVVFEVGFSARNVDDHRRLVEGLSAFPPVPTGDADHRRALEVQAALAAVGAHRAISLVDALVAAIAEARQLSVLHYDADFELIAGATGQPHQWIVAPGVAG